MRQSRQAMLKLRTEWKPESYHRALKHFEEQGGHYSVAGGSDLLSLPGWDSLFFSPSPSFAAFASRWLWDRVEIKLAADRTSFSLRWIYWTPLQTSIHFSVTMLFLLSPLSPIQTFAAVIAGNLLPFIGTLGAYWRFRKRLSKVGLKPLVS